MLRIKKHDRILYTLSNIDCLWDINGFYTVRLYNGEIKEDERILDLNLK